MKLHDFHDFFTFSLNFLRFNEFHRICKKSTLWRRHAKRQVIPMLFQWLQPSYSLPGAPKHEFPWIIWEFMKFHEISWSFMKFLEFYKYFGFAGSLGCQALEPFLFPKEYQGFVKGCGWLKTQKIMIFIEIHRISEVFLKFHKFHKISPISPVLGPAALARRNGSNSYGFSMVAARTFLPGHPKIWFCMKILVSNQNFQDFHEI